MSNSFNVSDNINSIFAKLQDFIKTDTVVGEPIEVGEVTIIPFMNISFGVGTGGRLGKDGEENQGGGAGSGAKVAPTAVLVIRGDKVELLSIDKSAHLEKLVMMVPEILDRFKPVEEKKKDAKKDNKNE